MPPRAVPAILVALWATLLAQGADQTFDPQALLQRGLALIRQNIDRAPRYTCRQTIRRDRYLPARVFQNCGEVLQASTKEDFQLAATDRLRLDVSITRQGEIFSWAGEKAFQTVRVADIAGGGLSSSGDFDSFLSSIFDSDAVLYQYLAFVKADGHKYAEYAYSIPRETSRYEVQVGRNPDDEKVVPYQGRFRIDAQTAGLESLTVKMDPPPVEIEACGVETRIRYHRLAIGDSSFLLPRETTIVEDSIGGRRNENSIQYDDCHEFHSESVFLPSVEEAASTSAPAPTSFPDFRKGMKLWIRLRTPVDFATAFAGDPLEGELTKPVPVPQRRSVLPKGTKVYGRLVTCRQSFLPRAYVLAGIRWDSIETPAGRKPLTLSPIPNGEFFPATALPGAGAYVFHTRTLDAGFITGWRVGEGRQ